MRPSQIQVARYLLRSDGCVPRLDLHEAAPPSLAPLDDDASIGDRDFLFFVLEADFRVGGDPPGRCIDMLEQRPAEFRNRPHDGQER